MKLKLDAEGKPITDAQGRYVFVNAAGEDQPIDVGGTIASVATLREEAKTNRLRAEKAESNLAKYADITDPDAALKALDTVSKLDQKKLIDAGKVDEVRNEITKGYETKLTAEKDRADKAEQALHGEMIGGAFARSKFIAEKLTLPGDMVQAVFGSAFKLEEGKIVAYNPDGTKVYSPANPGQFADFEEALGVLVEKYPHRDTILKSTHKGGGAAPAGPGGKQQPGGNKTITRQEFDKLGPLERSQHVKAGGQVVDNA